MCVYVVRACVCNATTLLFLISDYYVSSCDTNLCKGQLGKIQRPNLQDSSVLDRGRSGMLPSAKERMSLV